MSRLVKVVLFVLLGLVIMGALAVLAVFPLQREIEDTPRPSIIGVQEWANSEPVALEDLHGRVVLLDFWTYTCVNCLRTLPYLQAWDDTYRDAGLTIIGIHTPEFDFEKDLGNVKQAVKDLGVDWPVALDNSRLTWTSFQVNAWPTKVLIDADGVVRYRNSGEGHYRETEEEIRNLLQKAGMSVPAAFSTAPGAPNFDAYRGITREVYAGKAWEAFSFPPYLGNPGGHSVSAKDFKDPGERKDGSFYLHGLWRSEDEDVVHARATEGYTDYLALPFNAGEANAVLRPMTDQPFRLRVTLDGKPVPEGSRGADIQMDAQTGDTHVEVNTSRLYWLYKGARDKHELRLWPTTDTFAVHSFTFGP